jgi:hypothetical protein
MLGTVARFAARTGNAFPDLLLAILSWAVAEFLSGCAAYAETMYSTIPVANGRNDPGEKTPFAAPNPKPDSSNVRPCARPVLTVISGNTKYIVERRGRDAAAARQTRWR